MINYAKISLAILLVLCFSRFIPHPPNFTSLLTLSFYIPAILGLQFLPALLVSFFITDLVIGLHSITFFTYGSVVFIALMSKYFVQNMSTRISGALLGAIVFFLITNFGVWTFGGYGYSLNGLLLSYTMGLPFFGYSLISTFIFSAIVESLIKFKFVKIYSIKNLP
tara:strand:- start:633 stop:1130 length:498 start_codon:yes stop_codon:yes gene_type:complete